MACGDHESLVETVENVCRARLPSPGTARDAALGAHGCESGLRNTRTCVGQVACCRWQSLRTSARNLEFLWADVAQLVEQTIRNRQVIGSSPIVGSRNASYQLPAISPQQSPVRISSRLRQHLRIFVRNAPTVFRALLPCRR